MIKLVGNEFSITLAVSWQNPHLLAWLGEYLDVIKADGTQARWTKKYFQYIDVY